MKRLLHQSILSMSLPQKHALHRIRSFAEDIVDTIIKIGIYQNTTNDLNHWTSELATWFSEINEVTVKPKGKKFTRNVYIDEVFGSFGDSISDVRSAIHAWQLHNRKTKQYPDVECTGEDIDRIFLLVYKIEQLVVPLFCTINDLQRTDILNRLKTICK